MKAKLASIIIGLIQGAIWIVDGFLTLRFILTMFGADSGSQFTKFIYDSTIILLKPFHDIFPVQVIGSGYVFEFTTLFAVLIYTCIAYVLVTLIWWLDRLSSK